MKSHPFLIPDAPPKLDRLRTEEKQSLSVREGGSFGVVSSSNIKKSKQVKVILIYFHLPSIAKISFQYIINAQHLKEISHCLFSLVQYTGSQ